MQRVLGIVTALALGVLAAAACGGESIVQSDDGASGTSGDAGTGQSGRGGSANGGVGAGPAGGVAGTLDRGGTSGTSFGGSSIGGSSIGGSSIGGSSIGGSSIGGSSIGGSAAMGGSSGSAGGGGICSWPLESGACDAYFRAYGFSTATGNCQPFIYGGCGGNENRFSTLAECEARCGGSLSTCLARSPAGHSCMREGQICTYNLENCLCAP